MAANKSVLVRGPNAIDGFGYLRPGLHVEVSVRGRHEGGSQAWPKIVSTGPKKHVVRFTKADQRRLGVPATTTVTAYNVFDHDPIGTGMSNRAKVSIGLGVALIGGWLLLK